MCLVRSMMMRSKSAWFSSDVLSLLISCSPDYLRLPLFPPLSRSC